MNGDSDLLATYERAAVRAARLAGQVIKENFYKQKAVEHKGKVDLVTETDKLCEEIIFRHIKEEFPEHQFIGEEGSSLHGTAQLTDAPTWMVDPLDGTTNFVHRFPFVCVSIGLAIEKEAVVGVVFNPILDELYSAVKGQGAFLNGQPISVSSCSDIGNALLGSEIGTKRDLPTVKETTDRIASLLLKVRSLRLSGSCAMNLVGVACGRLDMFYEIGFGGPWDVAAGAVIVQEAGGRVFDPSGNPFDVMSQRVAASNSFLSQAFVDALNSD